MFKNILWPLALFVFWTLKKMKNWIQERLIGLVLDYDLSGYVHGYSSALLSWLQTYIWTTVLQYILLLFPPKYSMSIYGLIVERSPFYCIQCIVWRHHMHQISSHPYSGGILRKRDCHKRKWEHCWFYSLFCQQAVKLINAKILLFTSNSCVTFFFITFLLAGSQDEVRLFSQDSRGIPDWPWVYDWIFSNQTKQELWLAEILTNFTNILIIIRLTAQRKQHGAFTKAERRIVSIRM